MLKRGNMQSKIGTAVAAFTLLMFVGCSSQLGPSLAAPDLPQSLRSQPSLGRHHCTKPPLNETVLYSFGASGTDGSYPIAGLTNVNGTLYGTAELGGLYSYGTVFSLTTAGTYSQLYNFAGGWRRAGPLTRSARLW